MRFDEEELSQLKLLQGVSKEELPHLLECIGAHQREYEKGAYILFEGSEIDHIGAVLSGRAQIVKEDFWGAKSILAVAEKGDIFGESLVCGGQNGSIASFQALEDCRILFLRFRRVLHSCSRSCKFHQQLIENMVALIARKNVRLMEKMEIISKKTIRGRVLMYLSQQAQKSRQPYIDSPLGRLSLADYLCVDRSALTRELAKMKADGWIDYDKNTFTLKRLPEKDGPFE